MAYTPNYDCANFCYWMLNLSWQRLTGPQTVLVNTVYSAALAQTTVTDQQWKDFTMISAWRSKYYESWGKYASYYNANCQSWLNNLPSTPPAWYTAIINQFFQDLSNAGIISLLDRLWIFASPSIGVSVVSLINPTSTAVSNASSAVFTPYIGYTGNGTNAYLNSNFTPSVNGVNYTLNSASFGAYGRIAESAVNFSAYMGCSSGSNYNIIWPRTASNQFEVYINGGGSSAVATNANTQGLFSAYRTASNVMGGYKNGTLLSTSSVVSTSLVTAPFRILAGTGGYYSTNQITMAFIGSGSINQANLYTCVQTLMTRIGCQV